MTRANRERKKKKRIDIAKCMYDLPMFDSHFEPVVRISTLLQLYWGIKRAPAEGSCKRNA